MISVSENFKNAALNGSVSAELDIIVFGGGENGGDLHIYNENIVSESMTLTQGICDESDLKFGGCVASSFEIELFSTKNLTGKYITVYCTQSAMVPTYPGAQYPTQDGGYINDDESIEVYPGMTVYKKRFAIFSGEVYSCKFTRNRLARRLIAYDRFYWRGEMDATNWYKEAFNGNSTTTLGILRNKLLHDFRIKQQSIIDACNEQGIEYKWTMNEVLPGDDFEINKSETETFTLNDLLRMIGEINGVFMWLNGNGALEYKTIGSSSGSAEVIDYYETAETEEFSRTGFDCLEVSRFGTHDLVNDSPQTSPYKLDNELVTFGYSPPPDTDFRGELADIRDDIQPNFSISYNPFSLKTRARLWLEPGDKIQYDIVTYETANNGNETIDTVILSRRITGIQAMTDELSAQGECSSDTLDNEE